MKKFDLNAMIEQAKTAIGIDITKLELGMELIIQTINTVYQIKIINPAEQKIEIIGGSHFQSPTVAFLAGSTFGGNMIRQGWIGHHMHLDIQVPKKLSLTTLPVTKAKIIGSDWDYDIEW